LAFSEICEVTRLRQAASDFLSAFLPAWNRQTEEPNSSTVRQRLMEEFMRNIAFCMLAFLLCALGMPASLRAQQQSANSSVTQSTAQPSESPSEIPTGTRFLVALQKDLNTKSAKAGERFVTRSLDPLAAPDGTFIPRGAEVRGHVSRVEPGSTTGRARIWLSFDDIKTPNGSLPIVAEVTQVPGEHSVKPGENKEGEIEARTSAGAREFQAAAAGAAIGASAGAVKGGPKGAAAAAAVGGVAGFLAASGIGQELDLIEGTKLELELLRPLEPGRR
jgi:hypothetical protein